ncbi:hypothetical protein O7543_05410 [Solwaraspora sp. WMMA2080]|uniref:hypothetical protein n=1 Tax=unclassified Solwaraspora TaxID=2627926 RepID=UPI00248B69C5|nr:MULTISPECIES: hypothetical protein [unclassified Solwaraspora]WBB99534.1 hypothetical protein O7553_11965 [Solwaraspora sp. WMMA2059]WBC21916.1 hypothetical protein O7543_05410 [Solwaraspora sp. WMMA2080]
MARPDRDSLFAAGAAVVVAVAVGLTVFAVARQLNMGQRWTALVVMGLGATSIAVVLWGALSTPQRRGREADDGGDIRSRLAGHVPLLGSTALLTAAVVLNEVARRG